MFLVFALPRSRTAWLASFLRCGHDLVVESSSIADFIERCTAAGGSVETSAMLGWKILRRRVPWARLAVVRRPLSEVLESLARHSIFGVEDELAMRDQMLDLVERLPGVLRLTYDDLAKYDACAKLFRHCRGEDLDRAYFASAQATHVEIDLAERLRRIAERRDVLVALRREISDENRRIGGSAWNLHLQ